MVTLLPEHSRFLGYMDARVGGEASTKTLMVKILPLFSKNSLDSWPVLTLLKTMGTFWNWVHFSLWSVHQTLGPRGSMLYLKVLILSIKLTKDEFMMVNFYCHLGWIKKHVRKHKLSGFLRGFQRDKSEERRHTLRVTGAIPAWALAWWNGSQGTDGKISWA